MFGIPMRCKNVEATEYILHTETASPESLLRHPILSGTAELEDL
jgi:hypothetical protein